MRQHRVGQDALPQRMVSLLGWDHAVLQLHNKMHLNQYGGFFSSRPSQKDYNQVSRINSLSLGSKDIQTLGEIYTGFGKGVRDLFLTWGLNALRLP
jgi:hypothetical protein